MKFKAWQVFILLVIGLFLLPIFIILAEFVIADFTNGYKDCPSDKIVPLVSSTFNISFPKEMKIINTAKAQEYISPFPHPGGRAIRFAIKCISKPKVVKEFFTSFKNGSSEREYWPGIDRRESSEAPQWFLTPIKKGYVQDANGRSIYIYVDVADPNENIIYVGGFICE
jgi:hypothetical protein